MPPGRRDALQARGEVGLGADDRVVHAVVAAEIADIAVAGVDAHADAGTAARCRARAIRLELRQPLLHGDRHAQAGARVLRGALGLRIAEEREDGVADELVDRGAVRDARCSTSRSDIR